MTKRFTTKRLKRAIAGLRRHLTHQPGDERAQKQLARYVGLLSEFSRV